MTKHIGAILFSLLLFLSFTNAQTLAVEDFDYADQAHLTDNGWINYGNVGTRIIVAVTPGLTYSNYIGSGIGNGARLMNAIASESGEDDYKGFTITSSGNVYASFLVNISTATTTGDYFFHLMRTFTDHYCNVYVKTDVSNNLYFGLGKKNSSTVVWTSSSYSLNTTYLIVVKYTFNSGTITDDIVSLWVNPVISGTEPAATITQTDSELDATDVWGAAIHQGAADAPAGTIDGIRVATSWKRSLFLAPTASLPSGSGTVGSPYLIATLSNLYWITQNGSSWNKVFTQTADINAASTSTWDPGYFPIGNATTKFTGTYNGQTYKISGLYIDQSTTDYIGFFGWVYGGTISNVKLENVNIIGNDNVGGLIGAETSSSTVTNCYSTGSVTGGVGAYLGGLIGYQNNSSASSCYSTVSVIAGNLSGGLVGAQVHSSATDCYSTGSVSGNAYAYAGGLIGYQWSNSSAVRCFSTGDVTSGALGYAAGLIGCQDQDGSSMSNCFWDTQTSSKANGCLDPNWDPVDAGVTGKLSSDMKISSTFTNAGWNFTSTWSMSSSINNGYPYLSSNMPLPVELVSFTAIAKRKNVELQWKTTTEVNNYGFEIERRVAGGTHVAWVKIGFVEGAGTTNAQKNYSFSDNVSSGTYSYRLKQIDRDGKFEYSQEVEVVISQIPQIFSLMQNYPNPFNPNTVISYQLSANSFTTLKVYDAIGREVASLVNEMKEAGTYSATFSAEGGSASGGDGSKLSSGIYFYTLRAGNFTATKKLTLMK